jgi:biotin operon repressor
MRYERAIAISKRHIELLVLVGAGSYSSSALAEKLGISEQTVYRDILFLKRQGYPIQSVRLPAKWAYQIASGQEPSRRSEGRRHQ